jgi:predicted GH43/DUF377 family glycosyl hydrolase
MKWKKLGLIIKPDKKFDWMSTHAMLPTTDWKYGDVYRIYFSSRDEHNRSLIAFAEIDLKDPFRIIRLSDKPVLGLGELGCFDDNGVTPSWVVHHEDKIFLYYIGWKPRSTTRMSLVAGLAVSTDHGETFKRLSRAPILNLTDEEPFSILTAPCVLKQRACWKMWYVSGVEWKNPDLPRYNIKYAESLDGINWKRNGLTCINFSSDTETALARPCVLKHKNKYTMWYSYKSVSTPYRIGYAESSDGIKWVRLDQKAGITASKTGWDSEMIEYPFVIDHKGKKFMFYNGNAYGKTGIGLAIQD